MLKLRTIFAWNLKQAVQALVEMVKQEENEKRCSGYEQ